MFYEWKICNNSEIKKHQFPDLNKTIILSNYFDQEYRLWETENAISLYQPGGYVVVLFKTGSNYAIQVGTRDYYRLKYLDDGSIDVYHGQINDL